MAQQYDGSVVINTELDNSGFDKGSDRLEAAIKELTAEVQKLGQSMKASFESYAQAIQTAITSTASMQQTMQKTEESASGTAQAVEETATAVNGMEQAMEATQASVDQTAQASEEASSAVQQLDQSLAATETTAGQATDTVNETQAAVKNLALASQSAVPMTDLGGTATLDTKELDKGISALQKKMESLQELSPKAGGDNKSLQKMKEGYDSARKSAEALEAELKGLGAQQVPTDDYKWLGSEIDKVSKKLEQLEDKEAKMKAIGANPDSMGFKGLQYDINQARANLGKLIYDKEAMEQSGRAFVSGTDTAQYQQSEAALGAIQARLKEIKRQNGLMTISNHLKTVASRAMTAAKNLAGMAKKGLVSAFKKLGSALSNVGKSTKSASSGFGGGLKAMLRYGLGVRSLFALLNKLRRVLSESFGSLAGYDPAFNSVMSNFIGSLKQLGNAFGAAFAPVLSVVLPILTTLINALSEAVNRVGMMLASLTGKGSFVKATKVQYDYAKASNKTAGSLEDEADAAKEAKKQLMGFDQVNILSEDKDSKKDKNGGGDGAGGWTEVPVDDTASAWADMLRKAWEEADFTSIGRMIGEKLNEALEQIPWNKIKKTLRKVAKSIATFLNGFLETPKLFTNIGKTIAEGMNSAFEFVDSFVHNFHWSSLGQAIKDGVMGVCNNIDWSVINSAFFGLGSGIGEAVNYAIGSQDIWSSAMTTAVNAINALAAGIDAFAASVYWGMIGTDIATGLNAGIQAIDWGGLAALLIDSVNGLFSILFSFMVNFDFWSFGNLIGTGLSTAITGINWFEGAYSVGAAITGLLNAILGFVQGIDWAEVGRSVIDVIAGFFAGFDWGTVGEFISTCWTSLYDFFSGAVSEINWDEVGDYILQAVCDFFEDFDWSGVCESVGKAIGTAFLAVVKLGGWLWNKMKEFGKDIIEGGWKGILDKIAGVGRWIKEHVFDPFIKGFKSAFGIHSPSKEMEPLGGFIISGLLEGITGAWHTITDFFGGCGEAISNIFDGLGDWWSSIGSWIVDGIGGGIADAWDGLVTSVTSWCSDLWTSITDFFKIGSPSKLMRDTVGRWIPAGIAVGIDQTAHTAVDSVRDMAQSIANEAEETQAIMPIETAFSDGTSGLDNVLTSFADRVANSFASLLSSLDRLVAGSDFRIPAVAMGTVTPYSSRSGRSGRAIGGGIDTLGTVAGGITREELRSMLADLGRKIDSISFYISDENLARHVNQGNTILDRRYKVG